VPRGYATTFPQSHHELNKLVFLWTNENRLSDSKCVSGSTDTIASTPVSFQSNSAEGIFMIMNNGVSILRQLMLPLLLFGFCSGAYAGADPAPTDWLPIFSKISFDGNDTVFDAGETQIRLPNRPPN
jgi:hypothetical protein